MEPGIIADAANPVKMTCHEDGVDKDWRNQVKIVVQSGHVGGRQSSRG